jgi:hypothetical protein
MLYAIPLAIGLLTLLDKELNIAKRSTFLEGH